MEYRHLGIDGLPRPTIQTRIINSTEVLAVLGSNDPRETDSPRSCVVMPLIHGEHLFGVIAFDGSYPEAWIYHSLAEAVASSLEGSLLLESLRLRGIELEKANQEQTEILETLRLTREKLVSGEKLKTVGTLVSLIAHHLNNPIGLGITTLTWIRGQSLEVLHSLQDNTLGKARFAMFLNDTQHAMSLIEKSLTESAHKVELFKQLAIGEQVGEKENSFVLLDLVRKILICLVNETDNPDVQIKLSIPAEILITGDPRAYTVMISQIVNNSLRHAFVGISDKRLEIAAHLTNTANLANRIPGLPILEITFSDNGCGIDERFINRDFTPILSGTMTSPSLGMGLSIVNDIVLSMGGNLSLSRNLGQGTMVIVRSPVNI